jgi:UDP-4-amino-4,6-dideoxy-N-acetyl-beta-L-altrosamine transaminase
MIPYGRQEITDDDIRAVDEVLRSDWLTQGPAVPRFEDAVAGVCGARYAVAVNSATSALHIACLALDVGPGDLVWTTPITFVASANCARYCGAEVDLVDIDPRTYNMSPIALADKLERAKARGRLPKVVIAVHFGGQSCDMRQIRVLGERYGFRIVEDASHAVGGSYLGEPVGNCRYSHIVVFSFHPVKIITTGEGGMLLTQDDRLANRLRLLRTHGITREPVAMVHSPDGEWYYEQIELGFNYRITDMQAALGLSQLARLGEYVERRRVLADRYDLLLSELPVITPWRDPDCRSAWHLYVVRLDASMAARRAEVFSELRRDGIGVNVHYIPVYRQPYYERLGLRRSDFPVAETYYEGALTIPLYPGLGEDQQDIVVASLARMLK